MGLDIALGNALSGLRATQAEFQVLSGNIANAQTPGYARETLTEEPQVTPSGGAGVTTDQITRVTNAALDASLVKQTTISTAASTRDQYYQQVEALFGQVNGGNGLNDSLNTFTNAMQALATTPENAVAQASAVAAGQSLASKLNGVSSGIQSLRQSIDNDLNNSVQTLNTALSTISNLNAQIAKLQASGQPTATLEDKRAQALNQVAQLIDVQSFEKPDGTISVSTTTGQTLVGSQAGVFGYTLSGSVSAGTPLSPVTLNGIDVTKDLTSGKIGALLQLRDTDLPGITAQLNQFTNNLFNLESAPNLATTNSGTSNPSDANHFFSGVNTVNGVDNAASIAVNPSLVANPGLLINGGAGPDPTITQTLSTNLSNAVTFQPAGSFTGPLTTTLGDYWSQVLGQAANTASAATSDATFQTQLQSLLQNQVSSVSGVQLDQELSSMVTFQNAYSASARVVSTLQTMYDTLMKM